MSIRIFWLLCLIFDADKLVDLWLNSFYKIPYIFSILFESKLALIFYDLLSLFVKNENQNQNCGKTGKTFWKNIARVHTLGKISQLVQHK